MQPLLALVFIGWGVALLYMGDHDASVWMLLAFGGVVGIGILVARLRSVRQSNQAGGI